MLRFVLGLVAGVLLTVAVPLVASKLGALDASVTAGPLPLERTLGAWALSSTAADHAPKGTPVPLSNPTLIARGMELYAQTCAQCHGAPGVPAAPFARGLGPPAPDLAQAALARPSGELFWIAKHGVRNSAMPAYRHLLTDEALWAITAFVEHLPDLTLDERVRLTELAPHLRPVATVAAPFGDDEAAEALAAEAAPDPPAEEPKPKKKPTKRRSRR